MSAGYCQWSQCIDVRDNIYDDRTGRGERPIQRGAEVAGLFDSADGREGVSAFLDKRRPVFGHG